MSATNLAAAPAPASPAPAPAASKPAASPTPAAPAPASSATAPPPAAAPITTTKVFVGNLHFETRPKELQAAFAEAGNVISANIISRGNRSLGYGFVEFASETEAQKAVNLMNKKDLDGRTVNVEIAKPRDETADKPKREEGGDFDRTRARRGGGSGAGGYGRRPRGDSDNRPRENRDGGYPRRGGYGRGAPRSQAPRNRPAGGPAGGASNNAGDANYERAAENRGPSATTLFVANLPFSFTDDKLKDLFKPHGVTTAHVVTKRNGRSKGFGFVEFKNADDQGKARNAMDKQTVEQRELIVKVALTEPPTEAKRPEGKPADAKPAATPAPASNPPAPVTASPATAPATAPAAEKK